jgi:hypothetical protein
MMEMDGTIRKARFLAITSWAAPLAVAVTLALAVVYGMPGFTSDWAVIVPLALCAIFVPFGLGLGIAVCLLFPCAEQTAVRKHAVAGVILDCILIVVLLALFFMGEAVQPFIYAI